MTTFYLIRHGAKAAVRGNPSLTKLGKRQAEITARYLKSLDFSAIITSPKKRTQQTARIIAKRIQLPITTDARLIERMEWGDGENESFEEFEREWNKTDLDRTYQPTHGSSSIATGQRIQLVLEELSEKHAHKNILIITHGGAIGDFLRVSFGEKNITHITNPVSTVSYIEILECSITIVQKKEKQYQLIKVSDTNHLILPVI